MTDVVYSAAHRIYGPADRVNIAEVDDVKAESPSPKLRDSEHAVNVAEAVMGMYESKKKLLKTVTLPDSSEPNQTSTSITTDCQIPADIQVALSVGSWGEQFQVSRGRDHRVYGENRFNFHLENLSRYWHLAGKPINPVS